ncbi:MAG: hypothetical protein DMG92_18135 [Acidobacteria bacterium]|nr:MAG: hypothetical protein DMG92_18135 [Acidobacteriota bacterium]
MYPNLAGEPLSLSDHLGRVEKRAVIRSRLGSGNEHSIGLGAIGDRYNPAAYVFAVTFKLPVELCH